MKNDGLQEKKWQDVKQIQSGGDRGRKRFRDRLGLNNQACGKGTIILEEYIQSFLDSFVRRDLIHHQVSSHKRNEVKQTTKKARLQPRHHNDVDETTLLVCFWLTRGKPTGCYQRRWAHPYLVAPGVLAVSKQQSKRPLQLSKLYMKFIYLYITCVSAPPTLCILM